MKTHANEVHASKLPAKCPDCNKMLPGQKALKVHVAFTHSGGPGKIINYVDINMILNLKQWSSHAIFWGGVLTSDIKYPQIRFFLKQAVMGNDHEVEFHEIEISIFHEIEITIMRSKLG